MPPKRKAPTRLSGLIESDEEDVMQVNGIGNAPAEQRDNERPSKKPRGRPRSKSAEIKPPVQTKRNSSVAPPPPPEPDNAPKRTTRRGRPKGSRTSGGQPEVTEEPVTSGDIGRNILPEEMESAAVDDDELDAPRNSTKAARSTRSAKPAATRGRKKVSAEKQVKTDGEFEYTPTSSRRIKSPAKPKQQLDQPKRQRQKPAPQVDSDVLEGDEDALEVVDETIVQDEPVAPRSVSASPVKGRVSTQRAVQSSPLKRKAGGGLEDDKASDPELRRRLGDLTKRYDSLENQYRNLKEIGIVESNANMEKLRKQCEAMTTASNDLVASLKAELEAQKRLGQQSRTLQKQLKERDAEIAQWKSQAEETTSQLYSAQNEAKALQTKLAAARSTAASLESAAAKVPGSAIKNSSGNRAANAEAAHAAQLALLKEELYSDLTGLVILDVKKRESDHLYDCIQTGVNGTLHFKLAVPEVSSPKYESAEFQYIPLLDEHRDRDLVAILPEYLTVDITFIRQQASKFYTRVIDALTKRRGSTN